MSLVGNLKEMPLAEVLQFLGSARSSGKLTLTSVDGSGLVVFRGGLVIYAASNSVRETLGSLLVCRGLVDPETLQRALQVQHRAREERRLGSILVEQGAVAPEVLEATIRGQVRTVIHELAGWREGFFRFEPMEVEARGEVEVDARDFLLAEGLDAAGLAGDEPAPAPELELELVGEAAGPEVARPGAEAPAADPFELEAPTPAADEPELVTLRSFMASPMSPWFTGEVVLAILRCAEEVVRRCLLFSVRGERLVGMGGYGLAPGAGRGDARLREVAIPLDQPSVLAFAVGTGESYRGPLHQTGGDQLLVEALGGTPRGEVLVLPLAVNGRVVAVLYGDSAVDGAAPDRVRALERVIREAGLAMARGLAFEPSGQH